MASLNDITMGDGNPSVHEPFTVEENIHMLNAIDKSMVQLMHHAATALNALTTPASSQDPSAPTDAAQPAINAEAQKQAFRSATDTFLNTLHDIDVRMKRQILALEEAGIVNLSSGTRANGQVKASLKPNGVGAVGNLDVGWLNSRSTKVERDMELELWGKAKAFLETEVQNTGSR